MIRIGIDLEQAHRFEFMLKPGGQAFYKRVYTINEKMKYGNDLSTLSYIYTAKEAAAKVLGTGLGLISCPRITCQDIEIACHKDARMPSVMLYGYAEVVAKQIGLSEIIIYWYQDKQTICSIAAGVSYTLKAGDAIQLLDTALQRIKCILPNTYMEGR